MSFLLLDEGYKLVHIVDWQKQLYLCGNANSVSPGAMPLLA